MLIEDHRNNGEEIDASPEKPWHCAMQTSDRGNCNLRDISIATCDDVVSLRSMIQIRRSIKKARIGGDFTRNGVLDLEPSLDF